MRCRGSNPGVLCAIYCTGPYLFCHLIQRFFRTPLVLFMGSSSWLCTQDSFLEVLRRGDLWDAGDRTPVGRSLCPFSPQGPLWLPLHLPSWYLSPVLSHQALGPVGDTRGVLRGEYGPWGTPGGAEST